MSEGEAAVTDGNVTDLFEEKKARRLTLDENISALALLSAHCRRGDGGVSIYDEGWSDARIASEIGGAPVSGVARLRTDRIGVMPKGGGIKSMKKAAASNVDIDALTSMLADTNARIVVLEKENAAFRETLKALSDTILKGLINKGSSK